jgi:hypothetical protein
MKISVRAQTISVLKESIYKKYARNLELGCLRSLIGIKGSIRFPQHGGWVLIVKLEQVKTFIKDLEFCVVEYKACRKCADFGRFNVVVLEHCRLKKLGRGNEGIQKSKKLFLNLQNAGSSKWRSL